MILVYLLLRSCINKYLFIYLTLSLFSWSGEESAPTTSSRVLFNLIIVDLVLDYGNVFHLTSLLVLHVIHVLAISDC